jgi:tetratricopeptide (TPR) repeat protein
MRSQTGIIESARTAPYELAQSGRATLLKVAYWLALAGLIGLNAWRFWEVYRPIPELSTIVGLLGAGRTDDAEHALRVVLWHSPKYGEARVLLARILAQRDDMIGSAQQLHAVPFWSAAKNEALYREGGCWLKADRAKDAEAAFRVYIAHDPNHPQAKPFQRYAEVDLINLLSFENRWEETREVIWQALADADARAREELLIMRLRTILERSSPKGAINVLSRYVTADPTDFDARLALAGAAEDLGLHAEADQELGRCLRERPRDARAWRARLEMLKVRSDVPAAKSALGEAPAEVAGALWPYRGFVLAREGDLPAAADAYRRAIEASPNDADLYYNLALLSRRLDRPGDESAALERYRVLKKAREELPGALTRFLEEGRSADASPERRNLCLGQLSAICKALGWDGDAQEWARLMSESKPA